MKTRVLGACALVLCQIGTAFGATRPTAQVAELERFRATSEECATGGNWLLVYRYTVNVQEDFEGTPIYVTREMFDGQRFPSEEAAYCGARKVRRDGVALPGLARFGRDSNVLPESITPMPHLLAVAHGIQPAHPEKP